VGLAFAFAFAHDRIKDWSLLVLGGSNFADVEVITTAGEEPEQLSLDDSFRAQAPMRPDGTCRFALLLLLLLLLLWLTLGLMWCT
jgi:hypothetical protein